MDRKTKFFLLGVLAVGMGLAIPGQRHGHYPTMTIPLLGLLYTVILLMLWPVWLIGWAVLRGIYRFLRGPSPVMTSDQVLAELLNNRHRLVLFVPDSWQAREAANDLGGLPRTVVLRAIREHRTLDEIRAAAHAAVEAGDAGQPPALWWRWLLVGGVVFLIGRAVVPAGDDEPQQTAVGRIETIEWSPNAQWVDVKYRIDPVNVASGSFQHWVPLTSETGNVRQVWYSSKHDYMLIQLGPTVYHYCEFGAIEWNAFLNADDVDRYYKSFIRGLSLFDCRNAAVPPFP